MKRNSKAEVETFNVSEQGHTEIRENNNIYWSGLRATRYGYVDMQGEHGPWGTKGQLRLWFIWQGRLYIRTFYKFYGPVWAARLANEFAAEIATGAKA